MKRITLVGLLALLLVSCGGNNKSTPITSSASSLNSESSMITTSGISSTTNSLPSSSSSSSNSRPSYPDPVGVSKKTVSFYNGGFTSSSLEQQESQTKFVKWFNGEEDDLLTSIGYEGYVQINYVGDEKDPNRFSTMILGSQKSDGRLTFNFKYSVVSIRVYVKPYTKYVAYNDTYNIDTNATFIINKDEYPLTLDDTHAGETELVTAAKSFEDGTKSFSIANKEAGQRVFVFGLEITYWN